MTSPLDFVPSRAMLLCSVKGEFGVFEEAPDVSGDESFEASGGFSLGLAFAGSPGHVVLCDRTAALSGDRPECRETRRTRRRRTRAAPASSSPNEFFGPDPGFTAESGVGSFAVLT
jgi:hypothetical protein